MKKIISSNPFIKFNKFHTSIWSQNILFNVYNNLQENWLIPTVAAGDGGMAIVTPNQVLNYKEEKGGKTKEHNKLLQGFQLNNALGCGVTASPVPCCTCQGGAASFLSLTSSLSLSLIPDPSIPTIPSPPFTQTYCTCILSWPEDNRSAPANLSMSNLPTLNSLKDFW